MNDQPKTTYRGIEIAYEECHDRWAFLLRGKERHAGTLTLAKQAVDAPAPADKKPFTRQPAYHMHYGRGWEVTTVTSVADSYYGGSRMFWVVGPGKTREKVSEHNLFASTKETAEKVARIREKEADIKALREQKAAIEKSVAPFVVADNIE
jgi:hypothetical protein